MIISRTPFRISFFGGGTDYPVWYKENKGAVLGTTIDKYCYITMRYLPPFFDYKYRIIYSKMENAQNTADIQHPSVRECLKYMQVNEGLEIHHDGDLPARTGLGSSSSFTVGLLNALYALKGYEASKMQLGLDAIHIEQNMIRENVGSQDQIFAAFGGFNKIIFNNEKDPMVQSIVIKPDTLKELQKHLMLVFTGFSRTASDIAEKQIKNTKNRKTELKKMFSMVDEAIGVLQSNDIQSFGELLHESWEIKRNLTDIISTPQIDEIYNAAREAGATGGKLLGAGGGGFLLFFAKPEIQPRIKERLKSLLHVPIRFENHGTQIIFSDPNA
ncbi:MAG: GHMP kinase [Dehalococcoidales bacterium]|nr:GHMP kinase [Dehalococcoidales bacterium]